MARYTYPIQLLIADDHRLVADSLSHLLKAESIIGNIHIAANGQEAVDQLSRHDIDCVIMDINMPVLNGLEATRLIKKNRPHVKIIVVSMQSDAVIVNRMLKAGADAFINKDTGKEELLKAIDLVMNGEKYISPAISVNLFTHLADRTVQSPLQKHLTQRELEIVRYIANGLTNREIAERLFLSTVTVNTHRQNMLAKLGLKNTAALVQYAGKHGLLG